MVDRAGRTVASWPSPRSRLSSEDETESMPVVVRRPDTGALVQRFVFPATIADVGLRLDARGALVATSRALWALAERKGDPESEPGHAPLKFANSQPRDPDEGDGRSHSTEVIQPPPTSIEAERITRTWRYRVSDENPTNPAPLEERRPRRRRAPQGCVHGLKAEMAKVIVGQHAVLEELLIAIFARGHCLLIGVPGLAKTLMIHTLADALNLSYNRIQFTPDLMPSDITGTEVIQEDKATGRPAVQVPAGPDLRQHRAGRRDQPDPAQDPGRTPRGHAGAAGDRRRRAAPAARPVLRPGDPEPDRAGGDLSAPRGPARPVHAQHPGRLPVARRKSSTSSG